MTYTSAELEVGATPEIEAAFRAIWESLGCQRNGAAFALGNGYA